MTALFALLPAGVDPDTLLASAPAAARQQAAAARCRRYPRATDRAHLLSLVRAGRDRAATRWLRGMALAVAGGALLGGLVNGVLAGAFGMLGGLLAVAIPLGVAVGAFLGGFTAAMTGTEVARAEVQRLAAGVRGGEVLLQWVAADRAALRELCAFCEGQGWDVAFAD